METGSFCLIWKLEFPIRSAGAKVNIKTVLEIPLWINIFEARNLDDSFLDLFLSTPHPIPTFESHTYKTAGVIVPFLHSKSIISSRTFLWDIKHQYCTTDYDVPNFTSHHQSTILSLSYFLLLSYIWSELQWLL